jgi:hypothetical protein
MPYLRDGDRVGPRRSEGMLPQRGAENSSLNTQLSAPTRKSSNSYAMTNYASIAGGRAPTSALPTTCWRACPVEAHDTRNMKPPLCVSRRKWTAQSPSRRRPSPPSPHYVCVARRGEATAAGRGLRLTKNSHTKICETGGKSTGGVILAALALRVRRPLGLRLRQARRKGGARPCNVVVEPTWMRACAPRSLRTRRPNLSAVRSTADTP